MDDGEMRPLEGVRIVTLAVNVPGSVAAARLCSLGAAVTQVPPPSGDPLAVGAPSWYAELAEGQTVVALDLKDADGRARLDTLLAERDLLLTSSRPAALERLGLGWTELRARHPRLSQVAITGHAAPHRDRAGHDLTYQAACGLITPPAMPRTLLAYMAAAERAVSAALALLLGRARGGPARMMEVALADAAAELAAPLRHGLTAPGAWLGGGLDAYGLYRAREGWIALAALEPHFRARLAEELGIGEMSRAALETAFLARTAAEWETWADAHDLPLAAVRDPAEG
ncbi:MAG TPA: CoA transferase [Longimicrobium sp.]|nr:CoA transferase [Longimicrobium sp.]